MERQGQNKKSLGYMLFTGAMILCCIGLYLAQALPCPARRRRRPPQAPPPAHAPIRRNRLFWKTPGLLA